MSEENLEIVRKYLPDNALQTLREIVTQVRERSAGVSVLFSGPSGPGKALAAEALAGELGRDLHRVDLSAVVSKYIGETEKHLSRAFDAAEAGGAVLFFDEADALFGRGTEIDDGHDRSANAEVGYLLTRIEAYPGLAILAASEPKAIDDDLLRRIRYAVEFAADKSRRHG